MPDLHRQYNNPPTTPSSIGDFQMNEFLYFKKALYEAQKEQYFMPMASVRQMPRNHGKKIIQYQYIPLLEDENVNSQGIDANGAEIANGNLWGSSKDIGSIPAKFPTLTENGGRVNRVGFRRKQIEGSIAKYGIFDEYTEESVNFDSDPELRMHVSREMINGASEISEQMLQIDLINNAGVVVYPGVATSIATVDENQITYRDLLRLHLTLGQNRTPLETKVITGTRRVDTKTVAGGRVLYIGYELQPLFEEMVDLHGNPAFVPVEKYAAGGVTLKGEIGKVGYFRLVVHPEMLNYTGGGADASAHSEYYSTGGNFDVFPMLCVGEESFTTIGFQTEGKAFKFKIFHRKPGEGASYTSDDPYGEKGFMSIKWYYGFMALRTERLAVAYSSAKT